MCKKKVIASALLALSLNWFCLGQGTKTQTCPQLSLKPLSAKNVVSGIDYPEWFGDPRISASDRNYLVSEFNRREWLIFNDMLASASEPAIRTKDGRILRLQPLLDVLASVGAALSPSRPRSRVQDTPSAEETPGNPEVETIDKELRWYRQKKYRIPPTIGRAVPGGSVNCNDSASGVQDTKKVGGADCSNADFYRAMVEALTKSLAEDKGFVNIYCGGAANSPEGCANWTKTMNSDADLLAQNQAKVRQCPDRSLN